MTDFYTGYRKTALKPSEVLVSLFVPFTRKDEYTRAFKQAKRRDDDIAIVNACFRVLLDEGHVVREATLVYGGMAATTVV
jgi:xanthine dehydrogenase/oxidase